MPNHTAGTEPDATGEMGRPIDPASYGDEAPLTYLLGDSARVRVIGAFVAERGRDISISDVARLAGIARSTVYNHIGPLERMGVIEHTRDVRDGHSSLYQLNEDSNLAETLYMLEGMALQRLMDEDHFE